MRGSDQAGAPGARAPYVLPLLDEVFSIPAKRVERPGMALEPKIARTEPTLADGVWVEIRCTKLLSVTVFIERGLLPFPQP